VGDAIGSGTSQPPFAIQSDEPVKTEKTAYERQYEEYQEKLKNYNSLHQDYILKRSQYLRFETLTSQEDAHNATVKMLQARDETVISYFLTLKIKLLDDENVPEELVEILFRFWRSLGYFLYFVWNPLNPSFSPKRVFLF